MELSGDPLLITQFIRPSDEARHPGPPVYPVATDAGEHTMVCLVRRW